MRNRVETLPGAFSKKATLGQLAHGRCRAPRKEVSGTTMEKVNRHVQKMTSGVGWISLTIGLFLTLTPGGSARLLGWGDRERLALLVGVGDLVIGPGLLLDRNHRQRWMRARALLSATIALSYAWVLLAGSSRRQKRAHRCSGLCSVSQPQTICCRGVFAIQEANQTYG